MGRVHPLTHTFFWPGTLLSRCNAYHTSFLVCHDAHCLAWSARRASLAVPMPTPCARPCTAWLVRCPMHCSAVLRPIFNDSFIRTRTGLVRHTGDCADLVPCRACHYAGRTMPRALGGIAGPTPRASHRAARPTHHTTGRAAPNPTHSTRILGNFSKSGMLLGLYAIHLTKVLNELFSEFWDLALGTAIAPDMHILLKFRTWRLAPAVAPCPSSQLLKPSPWAPYTWEAICMARGVSPMYNS
ncbi:hypothetical protein HAX54_015401 [Datura stramonium]|uniref:Uncharacterized protein n=1 Tax=Datura stramonium TaxID=4076 RepID=A0ABS8TRU9_DATST|nr:hypothetical protein [Datura stramonium]